MHLTLLVDREGRIAISQRESPWGQVESNSRRMAKLGTGQLLAVPRVTLCSGNMIDLSLSLLFYS
jgi:hypothetical protein